MIWALVILSPLVAAALVPLIGPGKRGAGLCLALAAVPALVLALGDFAGVTAIWFLLESHFGLDAPRRILLVLAAALWSLAGWFAGSYMMEDQRRRSFAFFFGGTMSGNFGLLVAADVASFYTFFALMTFASYGLVIHLRTETARRAARIYLVMAILGELFLITALYFAVLRADSLLLSDLAPALAVAGDGAWIFLLGLIGFGVKVGAVPLYFWLPLAHPVAPTPASAVLSGAMIKAGLVGWMHLAPVGLVDWSGLALLMVTLGFVAALGAVVVGLMQVDPKTNLAYSSISQMGLMTALLGLGLVGNVSAAILLPALALYAFNHGTAKGLLFLGTALPAKVGGRWRLLMWVGLVIGALAIAGAPLTGGLWTKYFLKTFLDETSLSGATFFLMLLTVSAFATTVLLGRFLYLLSRIQAPKEKKVPSYFVPWLILLGAGGWWTLSGLLLPGDLLEYMTKEHPLASVYFSPGVLFGSLWPILLGAFFLVVTLRVGRLNRWPTKEPLVPPGDLLVLLLAAGRPIVRGLRRSVVILDRLTKRATSPEQAVYNLFETPETKQKTDHAETVLRRWEVAGISFLVLFLTLFLLLR